ncbi:hypothetical protein CI238_10499, partial [Colletotrichum incanum]
LVAVLDDPGDRHSVGPTAGERHASLEDEESNPAALTASEETLAEIRGMLDVAEAIHCKRSARIKTVSACQSNMRARAKNFHGDQEFMQRQVDGDGGSHVNVPASLIIGAMLAREHPRYINHECKDNLNGFVPLGDDPLGKSLAVIRQPLGQSAGGREKEGRRGHDGGAQEGRPRTGERWGINLWVKTPTGVSELAMEAESEKRFCFFFGHETHGDGIYVVADIEVDADSGEEGLHLGVLVGLLDVLLFATGAGTRLLRREAADGLGRKLQVRGTRQ